MPYLTLVSLAAVAALATPGVATVSRSSWTNGNGASG